MAQKYRGRSNPYDPTTGGSAPNLTPGPTNCSITAPLLTMDLTSHTLPLPRLPIRRVNDQTGVTVPAFTDLKLHDITTGPGDPNAGPLDQNQQAGSAGFFAGNTKFITRKLWGLANAGPFIHHGKFTTTREAVLNHNGEVAPSKPAFQALTPSQRDNMIEFLKPLQTLPQTAHCLVVHENFDCKR